MEHQEDGLFQLVPGREHPAFPGFVSFQTIDRPEKNEKEAKEICQET